jgi:hypothetical protein
MVSISFRNRAVVVPLDRATAEVADTGNWYTVDCEVRRTHFQDLAAM